MVNFMKNYIEAERSGDWEKHLHVVKQMIPYFHAAGYLHYAKAGHIYSKNMSILKIKMRKKNRTFLLKILQCDIPFINLLVHGQI